MLQNPSIMRRLAEGDAPIPLGCDPDGARGAGVHCAGCQWCPLSDLAARFTDSHADNFDIYLPNWLAQYNKVIFGVLFIAGELVVLGYWLSERSAKHQDSSTTTAASNFE